MIFTSLPGHQLPVPATNEAFKETKQESPDTGARTRMRYSSALWRSLLVSSDGKRKPDVLPPRQVA